MTVNAITDTKKWRTGIAPTYLHTTPRFVLSSRHLIWVRVDLGYELVWVRVDLGTS